MGVTSEIESELDEDRISPIYEEPTDFASTIARLRNLLQQKSTATTPLYDIHLIKIRLFSLFSLFKKNWFFLLYNTSLF